MIDVKQRWAFRREPGVEVVVRVEMTREHVRVFSEYGGKTRHHSAEGVSRKCNTLDLVPFEQQIWLAIPVNRTIGAGRRFDSRTEAIDFQKKSATAYQVGRFIPDA